MTSNVDRYYDAVAEAEEKYRNIFLNLNVLAIIHDFEGNIVEANNKALETLSYSERKLLSLNVADLHPPEALKLSQKIVEQTIIHGSAEGEISLKKKNRDTFPAYVFMNLLELAGKKLIQCVVHDLTERKKIENELREGNLFFDSIIENIPDMIFLKDAKELRFVRFNKAGEELLGYSRDELLGKNDYDFFPKKEADFFTTEDEKVLKEGKLHDIPEEPIHTKAKGIRTLHTKKITIQDEHGKPKYLLGISEDITERKLLEESHRIRDRAFQAATNGILITGTEEDEYKIIHCNPAFEKMTGYSRDKIIGKNCRFLRRNDRDQEALVELRKALKKKKPYRGVLRNYKKDGTLFWNELTVSPVKDESGKFTHFIGVQHDITDRVKAEEALKKAHEELEQRVRERTAELSELNKQLKGEIEVRKKKEGYEKIISTVTQSVHQSIDLQEVMDNAVEALSNNIDNTDCVAIYMAEGDTAVLKCHRGYPDSALKKITRISKPKGFTWQTLIEGKPRYCSDVDKDTAIGPTGREAGTKSYVSMPIKYGDETIGCININSKTLNAFDEEEIKLLQIVANQIETAINNAKQAETLKESEDNLKEKLEQLSKKNKYEEIISAVTRSVHQSINLEDVFENAVEAMSQNIDQANIVEIYSIEDKKAVLKSQIGYKKTYITKAGSIPYPKGFIWKTAIDEKPIYCPDTEKDKVIGPAGVAAGIKTYISMPIRFEGKVFGIIGINSFQKHAFDEDELKLLGIVAKQIETAIKNAQQAKALKESEEKLLKNLDQLSRKKRFEEIVSTVTRSVHQSSDLQKVLDNAIDAMIKNIDIIRHIVIYFVEDKEAVMKAHGGSHPNWFIEKVKRIPYQKGHTWVTLTEGRMIYCSDVDKDPSMGPAGKKVGAKSYVSIPLKNENKTIGCINIHSFDKNAFEDEDLQLLGIVGKQIETAINKAQQAETLKQSEEALKRSEEHFRLLVETTNVIPWEFDPKTNKFTYVGPQAEELLGYPINNWYEEDFWPSLILEEDRDQVLDTCRVATEALKDHVLEYRMLSQEGQLVWIYEMVSVISENGEPIALRGFMIDVTEQKQADSLLLSEKRILEMISEGKPLSEILDHICLAVEKQSNQMLCSFCLVDDTGKALVSCAAPSLSPDYAKDIGRLPIGPDIASCGTAAYTKKQVIASDTSTDPLWTDFQDLAINHNLQACWSTPILSNSDELHGTFAMYYSEPREPIQWEFDIIERATHLARIAIERKKAEETLKENLNELSKKNKYEKIVSTVTQSVHRSIDLQEVLENAVEAMTENIEIVEHVSIYFVEGKEAVIQIQKGFPDGFIEKVRRIPHPKGFTWNTILEGKTRYCPDVEKDTIIGPAGRQAGSKSYLSIPLKVEGNTIGCINVHSYQKNAFEENDINLLEVVAKQIEIAINKSKNAEALRNSEERYRTLVENAYDLIVEIGIDSRFVYVSPNHKDVLGYEPNELIGRDIYENIHPDDRPSVRANFQKSAGNICSILGLSFNELLTGNIFEVFHANDLPALRTKLEDAVRAQLATEESSSSYRYRHSNGEWRWLESTGQPFWTSTGEIRVVISSRDITDRRRAELELKNAFSEIEKLKNQLERENIYLQEEVKFQHSHSEIIGDSKAMQKVLSLAEQVANTESTVLLLGETGTGKELLANAIHNMSPRKERAIVMVNCAALQPNLIESELFGHERGAFTGAVTTRLGRFEIADGSTIFLDEVGELPFELQSKLLRVLQEGSFERLGSGKTIEVDVRVLAATNQDLRKAVEEGDFREDLFYRLNVFPINIPPLRERREDIPLLVNRLVEEYGDKMGKKIDNISKKTMEALMSYKWPGNIRELRNVIEKAMILSSGSTLQLDLPNVKHSPRDQSASLEEVEKNHIRQILDRTGWRVRGSGGAAEALGLNPNTLDSKMKKLGIKRGHSKH